MAKAIYMFGCSCPVIGQGAGDEIIAVFITILMAVNLYMYLLYIPKSQATFGEGHEYIIDDCINTSCNMYTFLHQYYYVLHICVQKS